MSRNIPDEHELSQGQGGRWPEVWVWVSILIGADSHQQRTNAAQQRVSCKGNEGLSQGKRTFYFRDSKKNLKDSTSLGDFFHYTNIKMTISTLPVTISTSHTLRMYSASASSSAAPAKPSSSSMASAVLLSFKENFNQFCFHCNNEI